ncbi:glycosyltransferase [Aerococcus urinaeequi]|uniref:glycosyltransferase n=1 Tax=Aerococcus urinaeequi TaxID=51665 RepID=UPI003B45B7FB
MQELVSVICTVKNGEKTIKNTIQSVLNQTYSNFEFIIIDDNSSDSTPDILNWFQTRDSRIKVYRFEKLGRANALNKAISLSNGKYIANIDADDLFHQKKIQIQEELMSNLHNTFLICSESEIIYDDDFPQWEKEKDWNFNKEKITSKILVKNYISHITVFMDKQKLEDIGGYSIAQKTQVDYELWLRAFTEDENMYYYNQYLSAKRIHNNQSFENKKRVKYTYNSMILQMRYILKNPKYLYYLPIPFVSFIFGQLPFGVRRRIHKFLFK